MLCSGRACLLPAGGHAHRRAATRPGAAATHPLRAAALKKGELDAGCLQVLGQLGEGSFGQVYRVSGLHHNVVVVVVVVEGGGGSSGKNPRASTHARSYARAHTHNPPHTPHTPNPLQCCRATTGRMTGGGARASRFRWCSSE